MALPSVVSLKDEITVVQVKGPNNCLPARVDLNLSHTLSVPEIKELFFNLREK